MKLLLIRHGESIDDVENRYGGWVDFPLTEKGKSQAADAINKIKGLEIDFRKIYSSPLSRASGVAEILSKSLNVDVEIYEYLKEHNKYGLLSGMEKEEAKKKYPEEVSKLDNGEKVDGAEDERAFLLRAKKGIENLVNANKDNDIIAVTHGGQVRAFFRNYFNKRLSKLEDLAFVLIEWQDGPQVISTSGIEVDQTDS